MLILCFLDSPDPKRVNPSKTGRQKFARLPKFPVHKMMGELKREEETLTLKKNKNAYLVSFERYSCQLLYYSNIFKVVCVLKIS